MFNYKNLIYYYGFAFAVFILLKLLFTQAGSDDLLFLLRPTSTLVSLITGVGTIYIKDTGYYFQSLDILIDKSCTGFNFWALSFLVFSYVYIRNMKQDKAKILGLIYALILAYFLTIFVNTSRIFTSIILQQQTENILSNHQHLIHEGIGITINLSFLIVAYLLLEKFLTKKQQHEKHT